MKLFKLEVLSILLFSTIFACSSTEPVINKVASEATSIYPTWYQIAESNMDSISYSGFATAIGSDSSKAIERADGQARVNLERKIAQLTEEIRTDLEKSGSASVKNSDFIIILRTAHAAVQEEATSNHSVGKKMEAYYRGFASVTISKTKIRSVLEQGFKGHPKYWGEFSESPSFQKHF